MSAASGPRSRSERARWHVEITDANERLDVAAIAPAAGDHLHEDEVLDGHDGHAVERAGLVERLVEDLGVLLGREDRVDGHALDRDRIRRGTRRGVRASRKPPCRRGSRRPRRARLAVNADGEAADQRVANARAA